MARQLGTRSEYGLELLKKAIIWRIGNGANVCVWRDPWLPRDLMLRPITPQGRCRLRWVADFLQPDGTWNMTLVRRHFMPVDVEVIEKIKPSRRNAHDFIAWHPDKRGQFTVRSAYRLALESEMRVQAVGATSSRPDGQRPDWKLIWGCPVPPKVRLYCMEADFESSNALATQGNKHQRWMGTTATCLICGQENEDTYHTFIRCPHARGLWHTMRQVWDLPNDEVFVPSGPEWLLHAMCDMPETQRVMVLMIMWRIWHVHNEITHQKTPRPTEGSKRFLLSYVDSLLFINQHPRADFIKGKQVVSYMPNQGKRCHLLDGR
jgi:hypothetical protein